MSNPELYISEVKELIEVYGLETFAKFLGKTQRGIQYWLAENPKKPSPKTRGKIHELFVKHRSGSLVKPQKDGISEAGHNGVKEDYLSGKNLENFSEAHRQLATAIARVLPETRQDQGWPPKLAEWIREVYSGKKVVPVDELLKELQKVSMPNNSYKQ